MQGLLLNSKTTRVSNAVAAGTSAVNCTILDMQGFEGVLGICSLNTLVATQVTSLKAQAGNQANGSDMADLAGAITSNAADADSNKLLMLEVIKPTGFRYLRFVVNRGTANATIDSVTATQFSTHKAPTTQDATTVSQSTVSIDPEYSNSQLSTSTTTINSTNVVSTYRNAS
jgi:hypothetical protein